MYKYGYRRITEPLKEKGYTTVLKLMHSLNLKGKQRKNDKYHSYKGEIGKIADNHFNADKPFEKLTTDVTQFKVCHEKVDLSPVMDLYNREIVSCAISLRPDLQQIRDMPDGLFAKLPNDAAPIFHSDQGWQYQLAEYQRLLSERSIRQSMSRKGNCMDNGAMENFFGRLKVEMFYREHFETVDEFINCLKEYIHYYNNERTVSKLKMSPVNFRTHSLQSSYFLSKLLGSLQFAAVFGFQIIPGPSATDKSPDNRCGPARYIQWLSGDGG